MKLQTVNSCTLFRPEETRRLNQSHFQHLDPGLSVQTDENLQDLPFGRVVDVTLVTYFHDTSVPIVAQILIACDNCYQHVASVITLVLSHSQALLL